MVSERTDYSPATVKRARAFLVAQGLVERDRSGGAQFDALAHCVERPPRVTSRQPEQLEQACFPGGRAAVAVRTRRRRGSPVRPAAQVPAVPASSAADVMPSGPGLLPTDWSDWWWSAIGNGVGGVLTVLLLGLLALPILSAASHLDRIGQSFHNRRLVLGAAVIASVGGVAELVERRIGLNAPVALPVFIASYFLFLAAASKVAGWLKAVGQYLRQ